MKKLLLDHVVLGSKIDLTNLTEDTSFKTLEGKTVTVKVLKEGRFQANSATVIEPKVTVPNGLLVVLDNYLFPEQQISKRNTTPMAIADPSPGKLSVVTAKEESKSSVSDGAGKAAKPSFVENVLQVLSFLKSGVRVFQHFLSRSNVSKLLHEGN